MVEVVADVVVIVVAVVVTIDIQVLMGYETLASNTGKNTNKKVSSILN